MSEDDSGSIHHLPPSPIHGSFVVDVAKARPESRTSGQSTNYLSAVLSVLRTTHRYSAYTFSAFSIIHFLNTGAAPLLSPIKDLTFADENLTAARALYQNSYASEAILVFGALGIHIASGVAIRLIRICREYIWYKNHARIPKLSWNSLSGYLILPLVAGHVFGNRYMPWKMDIDITSSFVGHVIAKHKVVASVLYASFVSLSGLHIANGLGQWLGWSQKRRSRVNTVVVGLWLLGLLKIVAHGHVQGYRGTQYDALHESIVESITSYGRA